MQAHNLPEGTTLVEAADGSSDFQGARGLQGSDGFHRVLHASKGFCRALRVQGLGFYRRFGFCMAYGACRAWAFQLVQAADPKIRSFSGLKTLYLDLLPPTILLGLGLQVRLLEFEFGWGLRVVVLGVRGFKSRDWAERIG